MAKTALVVEGGAMRGIFAAGVLDSFMKENFNPFDVCIGVSAGANNLTAYLAKMYQKTYRIYLDYMLRKDFINWRRFLRGGNLIDLDWLWEISKREIFIDDQPLFNYRAEFYIVVTQVATGEALYLSPTEENIFDLLKAGCAMPTAYRRFPVIDNEQMTDGGVADPLPVRQAYNLGATNIVVIRSRLQSTCSNDRLERLFCRLYLYKHKKLAQKLARNHFLYEQSLEFINNPPVDATVTVISPSQKFNTRTFTKDRRKLKKDYQLGREAGRRFLNKWRA